MTREISEEWKRHQSRFALEWRVSMDARRRIDRINPPEDEELRDKVTVTATDEDKIEAMQKDFHLLQAALATDQTIISLDETVPRAFQTSISTSWRNPKYYMGQSRQDSRRTTHHLAPKRRTTRTPSSTFRLIQYLL